MRRTLLLLSTFGSAAVLSAQQLTQTEWSADSVTLTYRLSESALAGSDYAVWNLPVLTDTKGDTLALSPSVFRGKRNRRYAERTAFYGSASAREVAASCALRYPDPAERALGDTLEVRRTFFRKDHPWLWEDLITLRSQREREGCCRIDSLSPQFLGQLAYVPPFHPVLPFVPDNTGKAGMLQLDNPVLLHISRYKPYAPTRVLRKEKGALWVNFELDRYKILHDFRDNGPTLDRIVEITRDIMADTTSSVKLIQIIGMASIDGAVAHNVRLADNRAQALKRYIQDRVPQSKGLFELANAGEGWADFRDVVADSDLPERDEVLRIIDTEEDPNVRERKIKRLHGGKTYAYLRDHILGDQRNSGYLRIYYDYIPDTAAYIINRAVGFLHQERADSALQLLLTVRHDARALTPLGVTYFMLGERSQARSCLEAAVAKGRKEALPNLRQIEQVEAAEARRAAIQLVKESPSE